MTTDTLNLIRNTMESLGLPYAFMTWKKDVPDRYWVGSYREIATATREEDGYHESTFTLNGFTRGSYMLLETDKEKIRDNMTQTAALSDGSRVAVFYDSGEPIPTGDAELKRIQIDLTIKEWRVMR